MRRRVFSLCTAPLLLALAACTRTASAPSPTAVAPDTLWLLARDPRDDAVHASDSEASLKTRYGAQNVVRGDVDLGEGESRRGTILFPHDSTRRLAIAWNGADGWSDPWFVAVDGYRTTRWVVYPGISFGTTLRTLERLNGRPFELAGFGWDYSGTVMSWKGGRLDSLWTGGRQQPTVRLGPDSGADLRYVNQIQGDRPFRSSHPALQALDPVVYAVIIYPR